PDAVAIHVDEPQRRGAGAIAVIGDARPADGAVLREPWARARSDGRPVAAPPALLALLDDTRPALTKRLREAIRPERGRQVPEVEVIVARVETVALVHVLSYILYPHHPPTRAGRPVGFREQRRSQLGEHRAVLGDRGAHAAVLEGAKLLEARQGKNAVDDAAVFGQRPRSIVKRAKAALRKKTAMARSSARSGALPAPATVSSLVWCRTGEEDEPLRSAPTVPQTRYFRTSAVEAGTPRSRS